MAIDEGSIEVVGTGKKLRTTEVSTSEGLVQQEVVNVSDPETGLIGKVLSATPVGTEPGQLVRQVGPVALDSATLAALELIGVKGTDGVNLVSTTNRLPVDSVTSVTVTGIDLVGVKGKNGTSIATTTNQFPIIDSSPDYRIRQLIDGAFNPGEKHVFDEAPTTVYEYCGIGPQSALPGDPLFDVLRLEYTDTNHRVEAGSSRKLYQGVAFNPILSEASTHWNFARQQSLTSGTGVTLGFTRASTSGAFVGSNGLLQTVAANLPVFEYDPVTLACKGLRVEAAGTNLLLRSEEFNNVLWQGDATYNVVANRVAAPDGVVSADELAPSGISTRSFEQIVTVGALAGLSFTFSVYLRNKTGSTSSGLTIRIVGQAGVDSQSVLAVGTPTADWTRYTVTKTFSGSETATAVNVRITSSAETYNVYAWGAQLESGLIATSYIATTTATVTRAVEAATVALGAWFNAVEGSVYEKFMLPNPMPEFCIGYAIDDGTTNELIHIVCNSNNYRVTDGGVLQIDIDGTNLSAGATAKIATAYKVNDFVLVTNGAVVGTDVVGTLPTVTTLRVGSYPTATFRLAGHVSEFAIFTRRLSNAELQALTA